MKHLRLFDKVGYIRFASVYRDFKDVKTFEKELKKLKKIKV
jgi:transcriptional repressor NrdR